MSCRNLLAALAAVTGLLLASAEPAAAFRLVPIEMEFAPTGRGATQVFRVENDRNEPAAIEVRMMARAMEADGADRLAPADEEFVVFPEQIVLMPGESQSVRVQYVGKPALEAERAYRLIAEQLPIDLGGGGAQGGQVRLLVRYVASVYVMPDGARPEVRVTGAGAVTEGGQRLVELTVENAGTSHQILAGPRLTLSGPGGAITLEGDAVAALSGENVLAGTRRRFLLPWPPDLGEGPVTASLTLAQ
ncbi:fimbrial biogenesis chaperone [Arenibaculum sp.]|jgi:fimbrial chaperone protein|uniref:fimbrial biogenesis chaperone n=1 Tax=Arenibaculum sp. TaxID=2865862 RepID=UPI002E12F413|nr:fimbria/pilus periplasmic chaperone [Arenibaculum sp.]